MIRLPRVSRTNPCRICGKTDYCGFMELKDRTFCICMRESEGSFGVASNGGYKHFIPGGNGEYGFVRSEVKDTKAPVARVNSVYKEYLNMLTLNKHHTDLNLARGFSQEQLDLLQYKTVEDRTTDLTSMALDVSFVPGFFKNDFGEWSINFLAEGYFIPVRDRRQRVVAMQIRLDSGKPKYLWFSSNGLDGGCSSGSPIHRSPLPTTKGGTTWITESPIKADFLAAKLGVQAIGIAGVNAGHADVVNALLEPGHKNVIIAFDGNWKSNPFVCRALVSLIARLRKEVPCDPQVAIWDSDGGVDDAFQNNEEIEIMDSATWAHSYHDKIHNIIGDNNLAKIVDMLGGFAKIHERPRMV